MQAENDRSQACISPASNKEIADDVMRLARIAILVLDTDGRIMGVNPHFEKLTGYALAEICGADWFSTFLPPETREETRALFLQAVGDAQTTGNVDAVVAKDGRRLLLEWFDQTWKSERGETVGLVCVGVDVTERTRLEQKYRMLFESSADAIMILESPDWHFATANAAAFRMFGARSPEEFLARQPAELSPEYQPDGARSAEKAPRMIRAAVETGSQSFEWTHLRSDGGEFPCSVSLVRMDVAGGALIQATVRDLSAQKRADRELREKNAELERMNSFLVGRELRMAELKQEIERLKKRAGE